VTDQDKTSALKPAGPPRRTLLASERTELAWVRTGLTALAVAVGVGRIAPELGGAAEWPFTLLGVGFALYGIALIAWGSLRARALDAAMAAGRFASAPEWISTAMAVTGVLLGCGTIAVIVA
jgi:putative membrane protein